MFHFKIIIFIKSPYDKDKEDFSIYIQKPDNISWLQTGFFISKSIEKVKELIRKYEG